MKNKAADFTAMFENFFELTFIGNNSLSSLTDLVISYKLSSSKKLISVTFECYEETLKEIIETAESVHTIQGLIYDRAGITIMGFKVNIQEYLGLEIEQGYNAEGFFKITLSWEIQKPTNAPVAKLVFPKSEK